MDLVAGRGMRMWRGNVARQAFMPAIYGIPNKTTAIDEKSYLEDIARRLEEELLLVKERIEKLRSIA